MSKLRLIDSHCHLNRLDLTTVAGDLSQVLQTARSDGLEQFLTVSVEREDWEILKHMSELYADVVYSVGWHPCSVRSQDIYEHMLQEAKHPRCVAIGETGLDYYHQQADQTIEMQHDAFRKQISIAKRLNKPLIIHTRQSAMMTLKILKEEAADEVGGVMHCFTESWDIAKQALDLGFLISISGIVTFKNAPLVHEVAQKTPLTSLLIETDAPYLAPVPYRGKANHPAWVRYVAEKIASLRNIDIDEVGEQTCQNFYRYFFRD